MVWETRLIILTVALSWPIMYVCMLAFFPILETLLKRAFWYCQQLLIWFFFYLLIRSRMKWFHESSPVMTFLIKSGTSLNIINISWCLAWAESYANVISNLSNSDSTIIQNHFLPCFNVFIGCRSAHAYRLVHAKQFLWMF